MGSLEVGERPNEASLRSLLFEESQESQTSSDKQCREAENASVIGCMNVKVKMKLLKSFKWIPTQHQ